MSFGVTEVCFMTRKGAKDYRKILDRSVFFLTDVSLWLTEVYFG